MQCDHASVVPAFDTGTRADLQQSVSTIDAQERSWTAGAAPIVFPFYYEWAFRTGENEDFESLVKLLQPRPMNPQVGIRDMDAPQPRFGMPAGADTGKMLARGTHQPRLRPERAPKAQTTATRTQISITTP